MAIDILYNDFNPIIPSVESNSFQWHVLLAGILIEWIGESGNYLMLAGLQTKEYFV